MRDTKAFGHHERHPAQPQTDINTGRESGTVNLKKPAEKAGIGVCINSLWLAVKCESIIEQATPQTFDAAERYFILAEKHGGLGSHQIYLLRDKLNRKRVKLALGLV